MPLGNNQDSFLIVSGNNKRKLNFYLKLGIMVVQMIVKRGELMSLADRFLKDFEELPEDKKKEVIDFIEFLKMRDKNELAKLMDAIIDENREAFKELSQ